MFSLSRRISAVAATAAVLAGGSLMGAGAARAAAPEKPYGTVTASKLNTHQYPSTDSSVEDVLKKNEQVGLDCRLTSQDVDGETTWYKLRDLDQWATARYMKNTGDVPVC